MKRPLTLTGAQQRQLRGLAHQIDPLVRVGKDGLNDAVLDAIDAALTDHELVKVRLLPTAALGRKDAAAALAERLDAHSIGGAGNVVILYRRHPDTPVIPLQT